MPRLSHLQPNSQARRGGGRVMAVRQPVMEFARLMEEKLKEHDPARGRFGWQESTTAYLMARLVDEIDELRLALSAGDEHAVVREGVDVANFTMMVADLMGKLSTRWEASDVL